MANLSSNPETLPLPPRSLPSEWLGGSSETRANLNRVRQPGGMDHQERASVFPNPDLFDSPTDRRHRLEVEQLQTF
jgi:hypothetical protein